MKKILLIITVPFLLLGCAAGSYAEVGIGGGIAPLDDDFSRPKREKKKARPQDAFIRTMARHFDLKDEELQRLWNRGYGRNELIKLILISKKSGKNLRDLVRERDKDARLSKIAENRKVNYQELLVESEKVRKELDYELSIATDVVGGIILSTQSVIVPRQDEKKENVSASSETKKHE